MQIKRVVNFLLLLLSLFALGCSQSQDALTAALNQSGTNRKELEKVLEHYRIGRDSLGYKSALFLITNMSGRFSIGADGKQKLPDLEYMNSDWLVQNIDRAVSSCRSNLAKGNLSFDDFCEYVLPYRLWNEPLSNWREMCQNQFGAGLHRFSASSPSWFEVNNSLKSGFKFAYTMDKPVELQSWEQLNRKKEGNCWAMASMAVYSIRSLGVPVTIDYVPVWGNVNGGSHAWNVVVQSNGKEVPFMGCESTGPGYNPLSIYYEKRIPAKVYRKIFSSQSGTDSTHFFSGPDFPPGLPIYQVLDVTDHYWETGDIALKEGQNDKKKGFVYLCVFSNGEWRPVAWCKAQNGRFSFTKLAVNLLYLPVIYKNGSTTPVGTPFFLPGKGMVPVIFNPGKSIPQIDIEVDFIQSKTLDEQKVFTMGRTGDDFFDTMDSVRADLVRTRPSSSNLYTLFYWDGQWKFHSKQTTDKDGCLVFRHVTANTIYRIFSDQPSGKERIFSYDGTMQRWW